ncbi:LRR receptor kinase SERK2-like [Amaranthus tricolor]|uniref:LRR receptor kinase SERK2-like n=1 Tax=Amaranthus tricolor TaxID=29722 RepID=UPI00258544C6|nr:LRR receptor kinase SERK2-like [Amaranthus tricolor]
MKKKNPEIHIQKISENSATKQFKFRENYWYYWIIKDLEKKPFNKRSLFDDNHLKRDILKSIGKLNSLHNLDLSANNLSGEIPISIGDCSSNNISSPIPQDLVKLINLETLNLSHNHLSGKVPSSFSNMHLFFLFKASLQKIESKKAK